MSLANNVASAVTSTSQSTGGLTAITTLRFIARGATRYIAAGTLACVAAALFRLPFPRLVSAVIQELGVRGLETTE